MAGRQSDPANTGEPVGLTRAEVALEVPVVDYSTIPPCRQSRLLRSSRSPTTLTRIKPHNCRVQPDIRLGQPPADEELAAVGEDALEPVERGEERAHCRFVRGLRGREAGFIDLMEGARGRRTINELG